MKRIYLKGPLLSSLILILTACGSLTERSDRAPTRPKDVSNIKNAIPRVEPIRAQNQKSYVVLGKRYYPMATARNYQQKGIASWYGQKFHGRQTANGERYDMYQMTAAHKTLPLPSYVEVENLDNGRKVVVRVNDRGPFYGERIIDLSYAAAFKLDMIRHGTARVKVTAITVEPPQGSKTQRKTVVAPKTVFPTHREQQSSQRYLQVATFSTIERAESLMQKLAGNIQETIFLIPLYGEQQTLYRVRIGPIPNIDSSQRINRQLQALGIKDTHVVVE